MLKKFVITLLVLIATVLVYAVSRPDTFRVERSVTVKAAPDKIFALIQDFHNWGAWSPYEKLDPAMKRTFSGANSGKGAVYAWDGTGQAGAGRMEILNAPAASQVVIQLDFSKPFESRNTAEFSLKPQGDQTQVTWAMYGPALFVTKLIGIFVSMDQMIGKDFETGLLNLKREAEK